MGIDKKMREISGEVSELNEVVESLTCLNAFPGKVTKNGKVRKVLRYTHIHSLLNDSTRPLDNSTNSTLHNPQRAGALVTSIMDGGPHGWVPVNAHSTPVLPKWEGEWKVHSQHGSGA